MTQQPNNQAVQKGGINMTSLTGFKADEISLIKQTVAKGTTDLELAYFLKVAQSVDLNPLVKEIWCYKDSRGNMMIFAGRDGFRSVLQRHPNFLSLNSSEVYSKDEFKMGTDQNGNTFVTHSFGVADRGVIIGAYAVVKLKDGGQVVEWADMKTYNRGMNTWKTHPGEMIKKVAEIHAAKKVGNIRGVYAEEEFKIVNNVVRTDAVPGDTGGAMAMIDTPSKEETITTDQIDTLIKLADRKGSRVENIVDYYKLPSLMEMTIATYDSVIRQLNAKPDVSREITRDEVPVATAEAEVVIEAEEIPVPQEDEIVIPAETPAPKAGIDSLRETANNIRNRALPKATAQPAPPIQARATFRPIEAFVARTVNALASKDQTLLSEDERQLIADCNAGTFRGQAHYVQVDWSL